MKQFLNSNFRINGCDLETFIQTNEVSSPIYQLINALLNQEGFLVVQTSGSTGIPKKIKISKQQLAASAQMTLTFLNLQPKSTALICLPVEYIGGIMMVVRAVIGGLHVQTVKPTSRPLTIDQSFDFCAMTPMQFYQSYQSQKKHLNKIGKLIVGGGPVDKNFCKTIKDLNTSVHSTFGMTETISHIALKKVWPNPEPCFQTLPGVKVRIDARGCLVIHAPQFQQKEIVTNDLVNCTSDHQFDWIGRWDNVINSGGIKVVPEMLEEKIAHLISANFFIGSLPDSTLTNKIVLFIEGKESLPLRQTLIDCFPRIYEKYKIPKDILFIDQFAGNQKINRALTIEKHIENNSKI